MNEFRRLLIKTLGGVPHSELAEAHEEARKIKQVLNSYTKFVDAIYFYAGNYPAWKAQQEFRNFLYDAGMPLSLKKQNHERRYEYSVDEYLGRIVNAFVVLKREVPLKDEGDSWQESRLPEARGDHYLMQE